MDLWSGGESSWKFLKFKKKRPTRINKTKGINLLIVNILLKRIDCCRPRILITVSSDINPKIIIYCENGNNASGHKNARYDIKRLQTAPKADILVSHNNQPISKPIILPKAL
jgi:hypothetical protein